MSVSRSIGYLVVLPLRDLLFLGGEDDRVRVFERCGWRKDGEWEPVAQDFLARLWLPESAEIIPIPSEGDA